MTVASGLSFPIPTGDLCVGPNFISRKASSATSLVAEDQTSRSRYVHVLPGALVLLDRVSICGIILG